MKNGSMCLGVGVLAVSLTVQAASAATYHVATNGVDTNGGAGWGDAWLTISNAVVQAPAGSTVLVSNGTYVISEQITITNSLIVRGFNGATNTIVTRGAAGTAQPWHRIFFLSHPNVVLDGFTITNGYSHIGSPSGDGNKGGGIYIATNGTVLNCIIRQNKCKNNHVGGGGVWLEAGGILTNCTIVANTSTGWNYPSDAGGVYMNGGGMIVNCTLVDNFSYGDGGAIYVKNSGTVRNCLVCENDAYGTYDAGGIYLDSGGLVQSCTIAENDAKDGDAGGVYMKNGGQLIDTIVYLNTALAGNNWTRDGGGAFEFVCTTPSVSDYGSSNVTVDPSFADTVADNYRLMPGSPCIDAGTNASWMTSAMELAGTNRILAATVDIGAYEFVVGELACSFTGDSLEAFKSNTVVFTAYVTGLNTNGLYYRWDYDHDGSYDEEGTGKQVVTNPYGPGLFSVSLMVSNVVADTNSYTRTGYIKVGPEIAYVALSGSHEQPYTNWATAATNMVAAADAAAAGTLVLVTNGTYIITNEINVSSAITVRSVSGPTNTIIKRSASGTAQPWHRIFYVSHSNAVIDGFTITNGYSHVGVPAAEGNKGGGIFIYQGGTVMNCIITKNKCKNNHVGGGGVWLEVGGIITNCTLIGNQSTGWNYPSDAGGVYMNDGGSVVNCTFVGNTANGDGGAVYAKSAGLIRNCLIRDNSAIASYDGGGVYLDGGGTIQSCTITDNDGVDGDAGGVYTKNGGIIENTVIYGNISLADNNRTRDGGGTFDFCCTTPTVADYGTNNISVDPSFADSDNNDFRLLPGSPCLDTGSNQTWMTLATDLDGSDRITNSVVDMGAYEFDSDPLVCNFIANSLEGFKSNTVVLTSFVAGSNTNGLYYWWDFDNNGSPDLEGSTKAVVTNVYGPGLFAVSLMVSNSVAETDTHTRQRYILVGPEIAYVALSGSHTQPYTNWSTAATNIHAAIDAATDGTTVLVTNGTYITTNEIVISAAVTVRSVEGLTNTIVKRSASGTAQPWHRIFYLSHSNAVVDGFTITNGYSHIGVPSGEGNKGGGVFIYQGGAVLNSLITDNMCKNNYYGGGGVWLDGGGVISNCMIIGNESRGWNYPSRGGGVYFNAGGTAYDCTIRTNWSNGDGGGAYVNTAGGVMRNCLISRNTAGAGYEAGGMYLNAGGVIQSCTVVDNDAVTGDGGGIYLKDGGMVLNTIVYFNSAGTGSNWVINGTGMAFTNCCTAPTVDAYGSDNTDGDPMFTDHAGKAYTLQEGSPCIDTGLNQAWMSAAVGLGGRKRIENRRVDMGAYEAPPPIAGTMFQFH